MHNTTQHNTTQHNTTQHGDGEIWYVIVADDEELARGRQLIRDDVVLVFPERVIDLREAVYEVAVTDALQADPEVAHDRVALREARLRLHEAMRALHALIDAHYGPRYGQWYSGGQRVDVADRRSFDTFLSRMFDERYHAAPRIRSELIVRRKLSGSISRARRQLIELLLERSHEPYLGLSEGYPPERALYESVIRASGMHGAVDGHEWRLRVPAPADDVLHVRPLCAEIERFFDDSSQQRLPLVQLYQRLLRPPFGIREPLIPLFFVVMYVIHSGEIAIYEHESYVPIPDVALFERLVVKPEHFAIRRTPTSALRLALFERVARAFAPQALQKQGVVAVLDAVKPMLRFVQQLPAYVRQTQALSESTRAVRQALIEAKAPDDLLYTALPRALGLAVIRGDEPLDTSVVEAFASRLRLALEELQQAYPRLQQQCLQELSRAVLAHSSEAVALRQELLQRMPLVVAESADPQLRAFALRVMQSTDEGWIEPVAALLSKKPLNAWNDADVGVYHLAVVEVGRKLRLLEQVATADQQQLLGEQRRRIGVSDARGERSVVVPLTLSAGGEQALAAISASLQHLEHGQRLSVIAALLEHYLPDDTQQSGGA